MQFQNLLRLFYKGAVWVHFIVVILLGAKQYFGDPIVCDNSSNNVDKSVFNTYCWITGTFTIHEYLAPFVKPHEVKALIS